MFTGNPLLEHIRISLPIIQAPMAGVSSPAMAAAVIEAGALGSIAVGAVDSDEAQAMIRDVRARSTGPLNVNVFCHRPAVREAAIEAGWIARFQDQFEVLGAPPPEGLAEIYRSFIEDNDMLAMLLEERPSVVSFHFGLPGEVAIRALRDAGITLLASATNLAEARAIYNAGIHAVIAQGWEAGGHRGMFDPDAPDTKLGTFALTRLLVRKIDLPVIAAGGIMDGAGIASAMKLGAAAAQLGTAFIDCAESLADESYRALLASEASHETTITRAISGRPARSLANRFTSLGAVIPAHDIPAYPVAYDLGKALHAAGKIRGELGFGAHWAGQGAPLARTMTAGQLVATLASELDLALVAHSMGSANSP